MNELNGEMELLQEQIQQIHAGIEQFQSQGVEMEEKRKDILRGLEKDLTGIQEEGAGYDARYASATKVLDQLKSGEDNTVIGHCVQAIEMNHV